MIRRPPRSTPFPTRRSSDLDHARRWRGSLRARARDPRVARRQWRGLEEIQDRKSTRLNSSHGYISYAVFCLKKKNTAETRLSLLEASTHVNKPMISEQTLRP